VRIHAAGSPVQFDDPARYLGVEVDDALRIAEQVEL
jgi:hypothetical protein